MDVQLVQIMDADIGECNPKVHDFDDELYESPYVLGQQFKLSQECNYPPDGLHEQLPEINEIPLIPSIIPPHHSESDQNSTLFSQNYNNNSLKIQKRIKKKHNKPQIYNTSKFDISDVIHWSLHSRDLFQQLKKCQVLKQTIDQMQRLLIELKSMMILVMQQQQI